MAEVLFRPRFDYRLGLDNLAKAATGLPEALSVAGLSGNWQISFYVAPADGGLVESGGIRER